MKPWCVGPPSPARPGRLPVPEEAKQREAEKAIRELFKSEYGKKTAADRKALARSLLDQAEKSGDDAAVRFVLLREAREVAIQASELELAFQAVDSVVKLFDVESSPLKSAVLAAAAKSAKSPEDFALLTERHLKLAEDAALADNYDAADKAATAAGQTARRSGNASLVSKSTAKSKEIAEAKSKFESLKKARDILAQNPLDPAANLEVGLFMCLVKGDWDNGRDLLAKGSDPKFKAAAERDLAQPGQSVEQILVGDAWWDLAETEKNGSRKERLQARARHWYEQAAPGAPSLARVKIEKRLESMEPVVPGAINLLRFIDPAKDSVAGGWSFREGKLWSDNTRFGRLEIPYEPPAEYDFRIVFTRHEGSGDAQQFLTRSKKAFVWSLGAGSGPFFAGFGAYRNIWVDQAGNPWSAPLPEGLSNGRTYTSLVQVRKDGAKGFLDGRLIKELKSFDDLSNHALMNLRSESVLGVGSYQSIVSFQKIELVEVSGKGRRTRAP